MARRETATLGGGCFWCLEAVYKDLAGVVEVESGYAGGHVPNPDYRSVCNGGTGHIEVVRVTFDPDVIGYPEILEVFFTIHDPTSRDRQGGDVGEQYRSVIFYNGEAQREAAESMIRELDRAHAFHGPIVTELRPAPEFYRAEDYHQNYFSANPNQPYCSAVVGPKVRKFREKFAGRLRPGA
jgi:peptide-methionine (S)-S-oxide reductase